MEAKPVLALPEGLELIGLEQMDDSLVITVASTQSAPCCPLRDGAARRVHSRYTRRVADLPCGGQPMRLFLQVRKCFCEEGACPRRIFVERLTPFIDPHGRVTRRLFQVVQVIGLATGGRLGVRVTDRIGIQTSRQTIIRRILALPTKPIGQVIELGVDDFSFRRGRTFGTILVDLSSHQVIDLLPERSVESAAAWMQKHPEIQYVSRDRGNDYAQAVRDGAPQARAVADRFHIYKNLVEAIEPVVARCYKEIGKESSRDLPKPNEQQLPRVKEWRPARDRAAVEQHAAHLAANQERFDAMVALQKLGVPQQEIAMRIGVTKRTIQNWNKRGSCPGARRRRKRRSLFDPYAAYVLKRWKQGCRTGSILYREIKEQGYRGTDQQVYRFLRFQWSRRGKSQ
jgi:transposase